MNETGRPSSRTTYTGRRDELPLEVLPRQAPGLRCVKEGRLEVRQIPSMSADERIIEVPLSRVRCTGDRTASHEPVKLVLVAGVVVTCPRCGRRYKRSDPADRTDPAVWPKDE